MADETVAPAEQQDVDPKPRISDTMAEQIFALRHRVKIARYSEDDANSGYKAAKRLRERLEEDLGELLDEIEGGPGEMPLFDEPAEEWRVVNLNTLVLSERVVKRLAEHEPSILTLGDLTDWQTAKGDFWAADINGIGAAAQDEITAAADHYWSEHLQAMDAGDKGEESDANADDTPA